MADRTESSTSVAAAPAAVLEIVADFESYPEWAAAVREVTVLERDEAGRGSQVRFVLDAGAIRDTYVLEYDWDFEDGVGTLSWELVESTVLKAMDGAYRLTPDGPGRTRVTYSLGVDLRIPMLGMLRRKAEKAIIDTALNELKKRAESGS